VTRPVADLDNGAIFGRRQAGGRNPRRLFVASDKLSAMEEAMLHFSRCASIIGAPLTLAALLACVAPAGAKIAANKITANGMTMQGMSANGMQMQGISATAVAQSGVPVSARITSGSALADLNGVGVEAVIIPDATLR
jgi:hypothetical protein